MTKKIETTECIGSKCADWYKCKEEKDRIENYYHQRHKEPPEWRCKFPYPGANPNEDDMLLIRAWELKKISKILKQKRV